MRTRILSLVALSLCLMGTGLRPATADATSDARKAIEDTLTKMTAAVNKRDVKGYAQYLTEDFVNISKSGPRKTKQQEVAQMSSVFQQSKSVKYAAKVQKFALQNGTGVATVGISVAIGLPNPQTKKDVKMTGEAVEEFTWVKSGSGWKLKQEKEKSSKMMLDGKPLSNTMK